MDLSFGNMFSSRNSVLSHAASNKFAELELGPDHFIATYIWVDTVEGQMVRGKCKVLDFEPTDVSKLPRWDCVSPIGLEEGDDETLLEHFLQPVAIYRDPFFRGKNVLVLCETFYKNGTPARTNHRNSCKKVMDKVVNTHPWFGIEQEFILTGIDGEPLAWPKRGLPRQELGRSHCASGAKFVVGRYVADSHLRACLYAGLKIDGTNAEAVLAQWEFQIGPCEGLKIADELIVARYLLQRVCEEFGVDFTMDPKPVIQADPHCTTGAHCNFSTDAMRTPETGMEAMMDACRKLEKRHPEHLEKYDMRGGLENKKRISSKDCSTFTFGIGTRDTSVRIPGRCAEKGYGYIEDRRPAGNSDPYLVTEMIVRTTLLDE